MKAILLPLVLFIGPLLLGDVIRVHVVDETASPIAGARTVISFTTVVIGGDDRHEGLTGSDGFYSAAGRAQASVLVRAEKKGYYPARLEVPRERDFDVTVVLPRIVYPVALYARRVKLGNTDPLQLLKANEWLGFDFEVGDLVAPYGAGKVSDIRFRFTREFTGWNSSEDEMAESRKRGANPRRSEEEIRFWYGKWKGTVEISFSSEMEGLSEEKRFLSYSQLKLPREAPEEGYVSTWQYAANSYEPVSARDEMGFFLRTRVKMAEDGRIIAANYAKVLGDFRCDARGLLSFTYYFNPTPNDRNLEFDPKRNLFPASMRGANVNDP